MIKKADFDKAYDKGIVEIIKSPTNDGVVGKIGENWFYFGGHTAEECKTEDEYLKAVPEETIKTEILDVLNDFANHHEFKDEHEYYKSYIMEQLEKVKNIERIRTLCYELYKVNWKKSHLITFEIEMDVIKNYYEEYLPEMDDDAVTLAEYIEEVGYHGEIYACFDEFLEFEYQDKEYIHNLLDNKNLIALYEEDKKL